PRPASRGWSVPTRRSHSVPPPRSSDLHMQVRLGRISGLNSMVIELLAALALGLVVFYAVGRFTAGEFAAFIGALLMLISPIKSLDRKSKRLNSSHVKISYAVF